MDRGEALMEQHAPEEKKDYLWLHLRDLPYFRALVRAVEARFYDSIDLPAPTLDLGCGDGHFASLAFKRRLEVGLDPWAGPVREASRRRAYQMVVHGNGERQPFADGIFSSAVSNSVLEHIPNLDPVLKDTARVLRRGAPFVFCVPNHNFLDSLSISRWLDRLGLARLAGYYRAFFNQISRHYHCDPPEIWQKRMEMAGFVVERWWHYFPPQAMRVVEWGHYFGLPSLVCRMLSGKWIIVPQGWNLAITRQIVEKHYLAESVSDLGVYTFYIARRR